MNVDGTNHQTPAVPSSQPLDKRAAETRQTRDRAVQESKLTANTTLRDGSGATAVPHDSFKHVPVETASSATYSNEVAGSGQSRVISGAFEAAREALDDAYAPEIIDLATAVSSEGLPLVPKSEDTGILKQDVLRAYSTSQEKKDGSAEGTKPSTPLDTLG